MGGDSGFIRLFDIDDVCLSEILRGDKVAKVRGAFQCVGDSCGEADDLSQAMFERVLIEFSGFKLMKDEVGFNRDNGQRLVDDVLQRATECLDGLELVFLRVLGGLLEFFGLVVQNDDRDLIVGFGANDCKAEASFAAVCDFGGDIDCLFRVVFGG